VKTDGDFDLPFLMLASTHSCLADLLIRLDSEQAMPRITLVNRQGCSLANTEQQKKIENCDSKGKEA